jgi:hypothetical protein
MYIRSAQAGFSSIRPGPLMRLRFFEEYGKEINNE